MKYLKKFWHWLRCEDEYGNPTDAGSYSFSYSENIERFPLKEKITDDDILQLSHKLEDGRWTICYVTIKQLKEKIS